IGALWGPGPMLAAAGAVIVGHMFPVWLGFRGGKGAATGLGVLLALAWPVAAIAFAIWLAVLAIFHYSSLAALVATLAAVALPARELEPQERLDWLRLSRTESIGPVSFYALLRRFGSAAAALDALPRLSRPVTPISRGEAEAELSALDRLGARLVCWGEPNYP